MSYRGQRSAFSSGSALARARLAAGLTQRQLADVAHISKGTICGLEAGLTKRPRYGTIEPLAKALGLTVADLWPTLAKAVKKGRLLDTVIPIETAVKVRRRRGPTKYGLHIAYEDPDGGHRRPHVHRPPICCGATWCRCVDMADPETYPVFGDPRLIEFAGGANA